MYIPNNRVMKTRNGTLEEIKLEDGKYRLIHKRQYHTEIIEVKANKLESIKKEMGVVKPKAKKDAKHKSI